MLLVLTFAQSLRDWAHPKKKFKCCYMLQCISVRNRLFDSVCCHWVWLLVHKTNIPWMTKYMDGWMDFVVSIWNLRKWWVREIVNLLAVLLLQQLECFQNCLNVFYTHSWWPLWGTSNQRRKQSHENINTCTGIWLFFLRIYVAILVTICTS